MTTLYWCEDEDMIYKLLNDDHLYCACCYNIPSRISHPNPINYTENAYYLKYGLILRLIIPENLITLDILTKIKENKHKSLIMEWLREFLIGEFDIKEEK